MNLKTPITKYFKTKGAIGATSLEGQSKEESEQLYKQWNKGAFNFLLQRTLNNFNRSKTIKRRTLAAKTIQEDLPPISDEILLYLYQKAAKKHRKLCSTQFNESGYQDTPSEIAFRKTLESIIDSDPKYSHLEAYPRLRHSKDLLSNQKMTVGVLVPDFIVYGIKRLGCTAVCFEINGDSHVYKHGKDVEREKRLESLGIVTLPIENDRSRDYKYIKQALDSWLKKRSGPLDKQIQRNKRKVWAKTVVCQFSITEIEEVVKAKFNIDLHLVAEAKELAKLSNCPRNIKKELKSVL